MKHAEIAAFFGRYDDAEKLYVDLDRKYDSPLSFLIRCVPDFKKNLSMRKECTLNCTAAHCLATAVPTTSVLC